MLTQITRRQWVNLDIANHLLPVVWICPGNGLVPIRQQAFNRTHDDKVKACHLVLSGHNNNKQKNRMRNALVKKWLQPDVYKQ